MDLEVLLATMLAITTLLTAVFMVLSMNRRNAVNDNKA
jgi:hypothetical protein